MRIGIVGTGLVGTRVARDLSTSAGVEVVLLSANERRRRELVVALGGTVVDGDDDADDIDVVVLATPDPTQPTQARHHLERGRDVVATSGSLDSVEQLLELDAVAQAAGRSVVAGAAFSPGLSTTLALHAASLFDRVFEVHTAAVGWGGPVCEEDHRAAARGPGREWRDGTWGELRAGSAKELLWFPEPIGARDCGSGAWGDPVLIHAVVPDASRVITRGALAKREPARLRARRPGGRSRGEALGAIRVEVRGETARGTDAVIYGAMDHPASATAVVAASAARRLATPGSGGMRRGAGVIALAALDDPPALLAEWAARGIRSCVFEGTPA